MSSLLNNVVTIYINFFGIFWLLLLLLLFIKKIVFLSFSFIFLISIEFPEQNINKSETGMGDKELSVEVYV